jgi:UDP-N-acetylmuramate dehydrogenase
VSLAEITADLRTRLPELRGTLEANAPMAPLSWFRTGGPAEALFTPADEDDLAYFLARLPGDIPVLVVGLGSNLLVRDGGVPGVVIRLGKPFAEVSVEGGQRIRAGAGAPDVKVASTAAKAGIAGLTFFRGIPGSIGGALRMNGGAYGGETKDVLVEATGLTRTGERVTLANGDMGFTYRHSAVPDDVIFTQATFEGRPGDPATIQAEMNAITEARSST